MLQSADILIYKAGLVPVGADQVAHVELTREVARRFNHMYGRELNFAELAEAAVRKMGKGAAKVLCATASASVLPAKVFTAGFVADCFTGDFKGNS